MRNSNISQHLDLCMKKRMLGICMKCTRRRFMYTYVRACLHQACLWFDTCLNYYLVIVT